MRRNAVVAAGFKVPTKMVQQLPQSGHGYLWVSSPAFAMYHKFTQLKVEWGSG